MGLIEKKELNLMISPKIQGNMEEKGILAEDVEKVVAHSRTTGQRFFNPEDSSYLANLRINNVTYWVQYKETDGGINIITVYCHRMEIVKE
ncbi:MAG: hypothetical protein ACOX6I_05865 [Syntrophomonadaceae bacterium]|jgi:glutamate synthase (NADPH/NADH) small chain